MLTYGSQYEVQTLGPILFSILNAILTLAIYALYAVAMQGYTSSWIRAVIQLPILALPDGIGIARSAARVYARRRLPLPHQSPDDTANR